MDPTQIGLFVALIVLLVLSAFFSSAETAYTSVNKIRLLNMEQNGNRRAGRVLALTERYDKLISTILVGNNIVNITTTSLAALFFTSLLSGDENMGTLVATVVVTAAVLIFGEITPKMIAQQFPERLAMGYYPIMRFFQVVLLPFNLIFGGWKWTLKKLFKFEKKSTITEGELLTIVETAEEEGELKEHESQLIRSAIEFEDLDVRDVMIPRVNVIAVSETADMESIYRKFVDNGFSRMPVYADTIDSIVGIIHEKDFYAVFHDGGTSIKGIVQDSICVSSSMKISTVLRMLQKAKIHMAIVVDEFGGTEGIVTLEDIIEELVGEIYDEHDEIEILFRKVADDEYIVSGDENVGDMFDKLGLDMPEDIDATTVGGYVIELMDKIPEAGESVTAGELTIEVTKASTKHVQEVKVTVAEPVSDEDEKSVKDEAAEEETERDETRDE